MSDTQTTDRALPPIERGYDSLSEFVDANRAQLERLAETNTRLAQLVQALLDRRDRGVL